LIEMNRLSKIYSHRNLETHALRNLSVTIRRGEFVHLAGASGSGKTTFLNVAGLLDGYSEGHYFFDKIDTRSLDDGKRSLLRNERIGFVFQSCNMVPDLSVFDNCDLPLRYMQLSKIERKRRIDRAFDLIGILSLSACRPNELSGGELRGAAVARAIAAKPSLLLADEPTANLDASMTRRVLGVFEELNRQGTTIVMASHIACSPKITYVFSSGQLATERHRWS
jgi:putative ABC transport system ATP-binding protein